MPDDSGWALPDSDLSPVPVAAPQPVQQPYPWAPQGPPPGRRPMPRWAKVVLGIGIASYAIFALALIGVVIAYFVIEP